MVELIMCEDVSWFFKLLFSGVYKWRGAKNGQGRFGEKETRKKNWLSLLLGLKENLYDGPTAVVH